MNSFSLVKMGLKVFFLLEIEDLFFLFFYFLVKISFANKVMSF